MGWGRSVPRGALAVYSVADEAEARALVTLACPRDGAGRFVAPELVREQSLDNLYRFSDRLELAHEHLRRAGHCRCRVAANTTE